MRKIISLLLVLLMLFALTACSGKGQETDSEVSEPAAEETVAEEPEEDHSDYQLPAGELWVDVPEDYVEYSSLQPTEQAETKIGLSFYHLDGSNINYALSPSVGGDVSDYKRAELFRGLKEEDYTKAYEDTGALVAVQSFEQTEVDGAPTVKLVFDITDGESAYRTYQIQSLTSEGIYTWIMSDLAAAHEEEFAAVMNSARISEEQPYETYLAQREQEAAEEDGRETILKIELPKGFKKSGEKDGMVIYTHSDGSGIYVTTSKFATTSNKVISLGIEKMTEEDVKGGKEVDVLDFMHVRIGTVPAVSYAMKDETKKTTTYYLIAAAKKDNTILLVDTKDAHKADFEAIISGAAVAVSENQ